MLLFANMLNTLNVQFHSQMTILSRWASDMIEWMQAVPLNKTAFLLQKHINWLFFSCPSESFQIPAWVIIFAKSCLNTSHVCRAWLMHVGICVFCSCHFSSYRCYNFRSKLFLFFFPVWSWPCMTGMRANFSLNSIHFMRFKVLFLTLKVSENTIKYYY